MPWFKVDDNYWSHPKVMFQSLDARGLWVSAASWAANHLTDGRVPLRVTHLIIPKRPRQVDALGEELESVGMWMRDGDDWVFHDWEEYQPTREKVEIERERHRERQAKWRLVTRDRRVSDAVTNSGPTRPDPTRPSSKGAPVGPRALTTSADPAPTPCEHGSESASRCALCRRQQREDQEQ